MTGERDDAADRRFMRRAVALARRGRGWTDPNPCVGCVIVAEGRVVGEGYHARLGAVHAEAMALERAGAAAAGATAYVTLEPCSHHGRTPPCADALADAGVARVVLAAEDPDPRVAGTGLQRLRRSGVTVATGVLPAEAAGLNPGFIQRLRAGRPWLTLKLAASLDGRTATRSGESQWITGEAARADVHRLRHAHAAILTGSGTVLADDPSLTARLPEGGAHPLRVILDSRLRTPPAARVVTGPGQCLILAGADADAERRRGLEDAGAEVAAVPGDGGDRLSLAAVLDELARREVNSVLAECGGTLAGTLLDEGLPDRLVAYTAPRVIGAGGRAMFAGAPIERMAEATELTVLDRRRLGGDERVVAVPASRSGFSPVS